MRISTVSKIGITDKTNPCIEGTANCGELNSFILKPRTKSKQSIGENTVCVATGEDGYEVSFDYKLIEPKVSFFLKNSVSMPKRVYVCQCKR